MSLPPILSWLNATAWLPLIYALLHTLWQGAVAAGGLFLALRLVPAHRANLRYGLSAAALALVVLAGVGSWALLDAPRQASADAVRGARSLVVDGGRLPERAVPRVAALPASPAGGHSPGREAGVSSSVIRADALQASGWVQWAVTGWLLGVSVFLLRAVRGTWGAGRLRRRCRELTDPRVLALAEQLRTCLGVSRRVRFLICDEIDVPSMLGISYPAVLLPVAVMTGVPLEQLRAILAHELAHIRRWDYLANLAQMLVEALLFFNPFVWWISRQIRLEREACCDRIAAGECRSPACYVEALVAVIERSRPTAAAPPILAASGPDAHGGNALERARRLLVPGYQPAFRIGWFSLAVVLAFSVSALGGLWLGTRAVAQTIQATGEKTASKPPDGSNSATEVPGLPNDVLAAARKGDAKQALSLLEASFKPKKFGEEGANRVINELIGARELRAFTTLYDSWHFYTKNWILGDELLAALVKDGRTDFLDALIVRRFDLNRLTKAAVSAEPATAEWITRRVVEVTKQQADIKALCQAAADNDLPALQRLVDEGADVNGIGKDDNTPLIRAVFKNHLEAAQWLLDHGAQVDKPRLPGWNYTPLCLVNSVPMAELLKKYGADVHAKLYERDVSILTYVADWAKADVVAWFLKQGLDAKMVGDNKENLLFGLRDGETAEVLLEAGADPNQVSEFGRTPLAAAQSGAVARSLLQHGANLKPRLKDGATLLEYAVSNTRRTDDTLREQADYIEELIQQGVEFDPKGNGVRAMLEAAFLDRVGEVRVLLDHGVSPDAGHMRDANEYRSALSSAAYQAPKSLKLLLERGADPNAPVPAGQFTPLDNALAAGAFDNVDLLRQAGAKGLSDLAYYTVKGNLAKVSELLGAQHADPNEANSSGWTPLRYAVQHARTEVARRLLDGGASVDQFDNWGFTPYLDFVLLRTMIEQDAGQAQMQWHLSSLEAKVRLAAFEGLFTQHPPNFTYRNREGRTALHQAAWTGNSMIMGLMLEAHPAPRFDPNLPDKEGRTALLLAALSPTAKETQDIFAPDENNPHQKNWNAQAYLASELLKAGARLDLVVANGKTVGELALAAARDAANAQLVAVLTDALNAQPGVGTSPAPTPPASTPGGSPRAEPSGKDAAPAASPNQPRDLADLEPEQRDAIWNAAQSAIKAGDIQTIDGFLRRGLDVNLDLINNSSLLFVAVDDNQLAIVKLLLAHGANILAKTSWGDVPLQRACWRGYKDIADALIQAGAPVDELWYATGMGDVSALEARDKRQPITPPEARGKLFFAVASGHPNTFEFLWRKLGPLDDKEKDKLLGDLYENAGKWGHPDLLPVLEALGATPAKDGGRALTQAAIWNFPETVKALLERGVPPEPPTKFGRLRNAAGSGHLEIVRLLLDHGADINVQDDHGFTPLSWAAYSGKEDVCLLLLERGADGRIKDRDGHNAAWHAAAGPHCAEALARMIKGGVPVTGKDKEGETILDHLMRFSTPSAWRGTFFMKVYSPADIGQFNESERRVVELLLAAGVDPAASKFGLLAEAMYSEHYVAARVLLDHGADPALKDRNGSDALFALVDYPPDGPLPLDLFKTLLQRDGHPNPESTAPGVTPPIKTTLLENLIAYASRNPLRAASFGEAVKIMLDGGATFAGVADANAQALLQGAARGNLAAIEQSVRQGAPVGVASDQGWDALTVATALGYDDCAGWLLDHGADVNGHHPEAVNSPLIFAVQRGKAELVERLLGQGAKIADGYDALYWAVDQKNVRVFNALLLQAGADPKANSHETMSTGGKTFTPRNSLTLYLCIEKGLPDMARALLDKGADADPPNLEDNRNLAYWAVSYERPEILQSLLDHGANPLAKDDHGESALDLARKYHPKLVPMLEEVAKRKSAPTT